MEKTSFGALLSRGYAGFKNNLTFYVALVLAITVLGYITDPQLAGSMATILSPMVLLTLGTAAVDHIIPSIGAGIGSILLVLFITAASFIVQIALAYFYSETVKNSSGGVNAVVAEVAPEAANNAS